MEEDLEIWMPIKGWENSFAVSSHGQIKALPRKVGSNTGQRQVTEKIRALHTSSTGKMLITLSDRVSKTYSVDRLVAEAFIPNPDHRKLKYVRHRDKDESNCHKSNLYWSKIRNKNPAEPRKIKGDARVCPKCGKVSLYEQDFAQYSKDLFNSNNPLKALTRQIYNTASVESLFKQDSYQPVEGNSTKIYFCGRCGYQGPLAIRSNTQQMASLRSDYAKGGWTYEALAAKYRVAVSTAWLWVKNNQLPIQN